jgi:hypothetical protein
LSARLRPATAATTATTATETLTATCVLRLRPKL